MRRATRITQLIAIVSLLPLGTSGHAQNTDAIVEQLLEQVAALEARIADLEARDRVPVEELVAAAAPKNRSIRRLDGSTQAQG